MLPETLPRQLENAGWSGAFARCESEKKLQMAERYWNWANSGCACRVAWMILCHGETQGAAERTLHLQHGSSLAYVRDALDTWIAINH